MSVYIKNMEMPKNCRFCKLVQTDDGYVCSITGDAYSWGLDGPPSDCPLIPVPDHGDLIDRNKIGLTDFEIVMCDGNYKEALQMLLSKIEMMPSVLDADKKVGE